MVDNVEFVAKCDYAANSGDLKDFRKPYPSSYEKGDSDFPWESTSEDSGICYQRSEVHISDILDGTSYTYMVGEKYMPIMAYEKSNSYGDQLTLYSGVSLDSLRSTWPEYLPVHDQYETDNPASFGSAHTDFWQVTMCDGSVKRMSYKVSKYVHSNLGDRKDLQDIKIDFE